MGSNPIVRYMKSLNTKLDGRYCSDILCEGNWLCQYWKLGGNAMLRCIAEWKNGEWKKVIEWHDDDINQLDVGKDDWRTIRGQPNLTGLDIIGIIYFADKPVKDFDLPVGCEEKCF